MSFNLLDDIIQINSTSKNLLITPNAIGDIILSSDLIKEAESNSWDIIIKKDFYPWVSSYLFKNKAINLHQKIEEKREYNIVVDMCGQDEILLKFNNLKSINHLIGFYHNGVYDTVVDFSAEAKNSSVFKFYLNFQKHLFGKSPRAIFPKCWSNFEKPIDIDLLIYPFSGSNDKNWSLSNFKKIYDFFSSEGYIVKFLNPKKCKKNINHVDPVDIIATNDWIDSSDIIQKSRLLLTNDSSISHIGAFLGTYTISLFLKFNPSLWFPYSDSIGKAIELTKTNKFHIVKKVVKNKLKSK